MHHDAQQARRQRRMRLRPALVLLHRYAGLVMAAFIIIAGLTGVPLVWYAELDRALNAELMVVDASKEKSALSPFELRQRALEAFPGARIDYISLDRKPDEAATFWLEFNDETRRNIDEVFLDPYTGEILGGRYWGDISQGLTNLMPFILRLHGDLALGTVGTLTFGIIALIWTIDCFVGAYLTFPARNTSRSPASSWWSRWLPAWRIRLRSNIARFNFDLHRASGLWLWALLFVFAWSSVGMNLGPVYNPVMKLFFTHQSALQAHASTSSPAEWMDWADALATGERLIEAAAKEEGFTVQNADRIALDTSSGIYQYSVRSDRDMIRDWGGTTVYFDAKTGAKLGLYLPSGEAAGDTVTNWLNALHFGKVWGTWFRVFISLAGIIVVALSVTGFVIWRRKRKARTLTATRTGLRG